MKDNAGEDAVSLWFSERGPSKSSAAFNTHLLKKQLSPCLCASGTFPHALVACRLALTPTPRCEEKKKLRLKPIEKAAP